VLEPLGSCGRDPVRLAQWAANVERLWAALGWPTPTPRSHVHAHGTILAAQAPWDCLFTATEANEWAWERASGWFDGKAQAIPPAAERALFGGLPIDATQPLTDAVESVASEYQARAARESRPPLVALYEAATARGLSVYLDDSHVSVGSGVGSSAMFALDALVNAGTMDLSACREIPKVLVTGSNGKTTTVRLLAAMARAAGFSPGYCCTEGVFVGDDEQAGGDYSGPAGARQVLRDRRVEWAVLETARGGIARRGLAVANADVAIVTNISADHFGEYGIDSLEDLADLKLVVARALNANGVLVMNADDPTLAGRVGHQRCKVALFAHQQDNPTLAAQIAQGGTCAYVADAALWLVAAGDRQRVGAIADFPVTFGGLARHHIENAMAAMLAAHAAGIPVEAIKTALHGFGQTTVDNPGRLEHYETRGAQVLIDYAHNPEGYAGLIALARSRWPGARVGIMMGHAGNRTDEALTEVASAIAMAGVDRIVVKEIPSMLRGRPAGEISRILYDTLIAKGQARESITTADAEIDAARELLAWSRPGDVLLMPVHVKQARDAVRELMGQ
jgi:cyanophycin synthetase